jgi:hypothetical protein
MGIVPPGPSSLNEGLTRFGAMEVNSVSHSEISYFRDKASKSSGEAIIKAV